jgi:hypothetical protein
MLRNVTPLLDPALAGKKTELFRVSISTLSEQLNQFKPSPQGFPIRQFLATNAAVLEAIEG